MQILYDPTNQGEGKSIGDLDERLGKIRVGSKDGRHYAKQMFVDHSLVLSLSEYAGKTRRVYVGKHNLKTVRHYVMPKLYNDTVFVIVQLKTYFVCRYRNKILM